MASITMIAASFLNAAPSIRSSAPSQRRLVVTNTATKSAEVAKETKQEFNNNGRRDLMFAAAAAAICSVAEIALADDQPKRGSAEAKRVYAPICVTMPTARICRN
ncbi:hypothetical protein QQ045_017135 [Rhodiola kirilowii]